MEGQALSTGSTGMMRGPQPFPLKAGSCAEGPCAARGRMSPPMSHSTLWLRVHCVFLPEDWCRDVSPGTWTCEAVGGDGAGALRSQ